MFSPPHPASPSAPPASPTRGEADVLHLAEVLPENFPLANLKEVKT